MKKILLVLLVGIALVALSGCPTTATVPVSGAASTRSVLPQTPTQAVYAAEVSLTAAANALADLHNAGVVVGPNYEIAVAIERRAHATLLDARAAALAKDATKTSVLLGTVTGLIEQLAIYNGGRK